MRKLVWIGLFVSTTATADVSIVDNKKTLTVDCAKDKTVNVIGNKATVTLTGTCTLVNISGNDAKVTGSAEKFYVAGNSNTINADGADEIATTGNKNTVTWKKGLAKAEPKVSNPGKDNSVTRSK
jgi:hypothetical protein